MNNLWLNLLALTLTPLIYGKLNTDSGDQAKVFTFSPEWVFILDRNRCSSSFGMGVHDGPEYAEGAEDD